MANLPQVNDATELEQALEIKDVTFCEISARRQEAPEHEIDVTPDPTDNTIKSEIQIKHMVSGSDLHLRCKIRVNAPDGRYRIEAEAIFDMKEALEVPLETMHRFIERVGLPTVFPFLRAELMQSARRIGLKPPVLSFYRPGDVALPSGAAQSKNG